MSTLTITEFLEARITEDETVAKDRPADAHIHQTGCYYYDYSLDAGWFCDCDEDGSGSRRILAECAAKRAILEFHGPLEDKGWMSGKGNDYLWCGSCGSLDDSPTPYPCETLQAIAAVYKDHPDYRQEWAL